DLAIQISREIRVRMQEWDVSARKSEARHWNEAHQDPGADEQSDDDYGSGARPGVEEQDGGCQVADADALQNSRNSYSSEDGGSEQDQAVIHRQADGEDDDCAADGVQQEHVLRITALEARFEGEDQRDSDNEKEER